MNANPSPKAASLREMPATYRLISFTGAGGKTTLIQWFAEIALAAKRRVVVTSTTKIFPPSGERLVLEADGPGFMARAGEALSASPLVVVACRFDHAGGKLIGLRPETVTALHDSGMADVILVEADGAARKPLKAPNDTEPVIPRGTDLCVAVMGLDAAYRPLDEATVHRHEIFARITQAPLGEPIRPESMIRVATAPDGLFKGCPADVDRVVFLNKADRPGRGRVAHNMATMPALDAPAARMRWFAGSARERDACEITPHHAHMPANHPSLLEFSHEF
ncbi:MAG: putative selenium-dependent hydroxylase accessory protein YqeC [Desulfovibrionaceae bacterium]|nr:putative selenium-dependent hydroxylase accessory protein YqeC [Desulfovibrionaceae bacterium]